MRVAVAVALLAVGCAQRGGPPAAVHATTLWTACPRPASTGLPADLPFVDRETLNLGDGVLGARLVYQRTPVRRVVLSVGDEPLDALEDLDMQAVDTTLGGRRVVVSRTLLQPGLVVVQVPDRRLPPSCGELFVLAEGVTEAELERVVASVDLRAVSPVGDPA